METTKGRSEGEAEIEIAIGGAGGAYLLASPGELIIDVEKRDRHVRDRRTDLRAILAGPDRRVLDEVTIPDDGLPVGSGTGKAHRARLTARVERKGIYALNITISNDRYGEEIIWGFRTHCPQYVIETSRGHKDEAHQEPIVLLNPGRAGDVCFAPRTGAFEMEATDLPPGAGPITVSSAAGDLIATIPVDAAGGAAHAFPADIHRDRVPWRMHLPDQQGVLHIDGLTRWESGERSANHCLWTPRPETFFPFVNYRWLLTPYTSTVYGRSGASGRMAFLLHNNAAGPRRVRLSLEAPGDADRGFALSRETVDVPSGGREEVHVAYTVPGRGECATCHLRVTPEDGSGFTTYSTLVVLEGSAPASRFLNVPLVLKPYAHENEQLGYLPDYPTENEVYFDQDNRPFVQTQEGLGALRSGGWKTTVLRDTSRLPLPGGIISTYHGRSTKVAFDRTNDVYLIADTDAGPALLRSSDCGRTFSQTPLGAGRSASRSVDIEIFTGHNTPDGPPPVIRYCQTAGHDSRFRWRSLNDLELLLPVKTGDGLSLGDPIRISERSLSPAQHSGTPPALVSCGPRTHVVWGEATEPDADVPGVPMYVATFDRASGKLGDPVFLAYGPPPNDGHNTPAITMDGQGYLHVVGGTHGAPFPYVRSLKPNDAYSGWTEPEAASGNRQTYIGLVCGQDDTLYMAFRAWWGGTDHFPAGNYGTLSFTRKRPDGPWEEIRQLVVPPFSEYSVYYHRLTIDRRGRLFISYNYYSTYHYYRNDHVGNRRALLMSPDDGETWKLAETEDFG